MRRAWSAWNSGVARAPWTSRTGGTGNYSDGTKWSLGFAPNNSLAETYTAEIPAGSTVALDMNATIDNLTLDAASSMLVMPDGSRLTIMGNTGANPRRARSTMPVRSQ